MRIVRTVVGCLGSIALLATFLVLALVETAAPELLGGVPPWVWWTVIGAYVAFAAWALLSPKARRHWREERKAARERKQKLDNFELD